MAPLARDARPRLSIPRCQRARLSARLRQLRAAPAGAEGIALAPPDASVADACAARPLSGRARRPLPRHGRACSREPETSARRRMRVAGARTGPVTSMWKTVDGLHMHARVSEGAPVGSPIIILVHGMVVSSRYMEPLARHLAPYAHVYV